MGITTQKKKQTSKGGKKGDGCHRPWTNPKKTAPRQAGEGLERWRSELQGTCLARSPTRSTLGGKKEPSWEASDPSAACEIWKVEGRRAIVNDILMALRKLGWERQVSDIRWLWLCRSKVRQSARWLDMGLALLELCCRSRCHLGLFYSS